MANQSKTTTALVAVALGFATVTAAAFVTISSTASVAEIAIDNASADETIVVRSGTSATQVIAIRMVPLPTKALLAAQLPGSSPAVKSDLASTVASPVPLPQAKPIEIVSLDAAIVPLPTPRPDPEIVVGSLTTDETMITR